MSVKTLKDWIMDDYPTTGSEPWAKYLDAQVLKEYRGYWIGNLKNVACWVVIQTSRGLRAVGFNENPSVGWSYEMVNLRGCYIVYATPNERGDAWDDNVTGIPRIRTKSLRYARVRAKYLQEHHLVLSVRIVDADGNEVSIEENGE